MNLNWYLRCVFNWKSLYSSKIKWNTNNLIPIHGSEFYHLKKKRAQKSSISKWKFPLNRDWNESKADVHVWFPFNSISLASIEPIPGSYAGIHQRLWPTPVTTFQSKQSQKNAWFFFFAFAFTKKKCFSFHFYIHLVPLRELVKTHFFHIFNSMPLKRISPHAKLLKFNCSIIRIIRPFLSRQNINFSWNVPEIYR